MTTLHATAVTGLFDTHLHFDPADDAPALLAAARAAGVTRFLLAATDLADARRYQALACAEPGVCAAVGVHPNDSHKGELAEFAQFRELAHMPGVAAIGEIGLDYYRDTAPKELQRKVFADFLTLAAETGLPAVVHCREAYEDGLAMLREAAQAGEESR
jgi:TatD DNase family protein